MCTLILAWQVFPDAPVVAAANRDEATGRPSSPPARRDWETPVVAPVDDEAGGTWIGYNAHGVLVAITNRWTDSGETDDAGAVGNPADGRTTGDPTDSVTAGDPADGPTARDLAGDRSRGLLVRDALRFESAEAATRYVERDLEGRSYEGFNLVIADEAAALYLEWDGRLSVRNLDPGVHVVVNVGADGAYTIPASRREHGEQQAANADAVRTALQPEPGEDSRAWLDRAATVVADHEYGVCVHGEGFGTRSSSLIELGADSRSYEFADGPPCETDYERVRDVV